MKKPNLKLILERIYQNGHELYNVMAIAVLEAYFAIIGARG